jgi:hypothetical protein
VNVCVVDGMYQTIDIRELMYRDVYKDAEMSMSQDFEILNLIYV